MKTFTSWTDLPPSARCTAAAIGNFDGLHLGHQAVLDLTRQQASSGLSVMSFHPHPRSFFAPDAPAFRLMNRQTKSHRLEKLGVDIHFELPFDARLSSLSARDFATEVLADGLGLAHVVVGADFCFGKGRSGNAADLVTFGKELGFGVTIAQMVETAGIEVSSTNIRNALSQGEPERAARMLGHWHRIDGPVLHGEKRGRDLGYPTTNLSLDGLHLPRFGVYAVKFDVLDGPHMGSYLGAANVGTRPMFGENNPNIETYVFDFDGDLYGAEVSVALVSYLRPEITFDSLDDLIRQMARDCELARERLAHA